MSSEQLKLCHETTADVNLGGYGKHCGLHTNTHTPWRTSSNWRLCSFCSSMRFCLSASSWCLCPSFCCCSSCCLRWASDRSLLASCSRRKSRLRVDSPGVLMMELYRDGWMNESVCLIYPHPHIQYNAQHLMWDVPGFSHVVLLLLLFTPAVLVLCLICRCENVQQSHFRHAKPSLMGSLSGTLTFDVLKASVCF